MRVPYTWLKDYINLDLSANELSDLLTRSGIEVEEVTSLNANFSGVIVGEVLDVTKHPSADKLFVAQVNDGQGQVTVVAGIDNMKPGDKVPLAVAGAQLPGDITIKRAKLRGVESNGMLCSAQELELDFEQGPDGILILDKDTPVGLPLHEALSLDDPILVLGLTPNRADCLGLVGVAYEVAALTGSPVSLPDLVLPSRSPKYPVPKIYIEDSSLCSRYTGLIIDEVSVAPSPLWMQVRLLQAGIRPISNIVDVTNYVMWEWGQPMHAFDYETLNGGKIVVRTARHDESLVTLDNLERTLSDDMLVIADAAQPVGLAGIMGGLATEITDGTSLVLLESAHFNPVSLRRTGRSLGLYSEAQQRFEKGVDVNSCVQANIRAALLIEFLGAGRIDGEIIDEYVAPAYPRTITLRPERARKLAGLEISQREMAITFNRQGFSVEEGTLLHVTVPTRRADLLEEVDLIEEVVRIYGYDKIDTTLPSGIMTQGVRSPQQKLLKQTKDILVSCGYTEVINYSFVNPLSFGKLGLKPDQAISMVNPLSEEQSVMRTTLIGGLLDTIVYNKNRNMHDLRLFELGAVYLPYELPLKRLPLEKNKLGLAITGVSGEEHWLQKPRPVDFFDLKGAIELVLMRLGVPSASFDQLNNDLCQQGLAASILVDGEQVGWLGSINPKVLDTYELDKPVYIAELDMDILIGYAGLTVKYNSLPRYPALLRDLAVVVPDNVSTAEVQALIHEAGGDLVVEVALFDVYRGKQIPAGCRSLAFAITYRDLAKTLSDEDVMELQKKIEAILSERFGASLRL